MGEEIKIPAKDGGSFMAYVAMPKSLPAPAVIVIQEIFGVNQGLRDKCDELAREGFIAVCPDLFWRIAPGIQLTDKTDAEWARAFELFKAFDVDKGVEDIRAAVHTFRGHAQSNGKVGCVGYCLGGKLAYLSATRSKVEASVGYYPVGIAALTGEAKNMKHPLMLHIAEEDEYVSKEEQAQVKKALAGHRLVTLHSYAGLNHAFSRIGGKHYDAKAAKLANDRTLAFLHGNLAT